MNAQIQLEQDIKSAIARFLRTAADEIGTAATPEPASRAAPPAGKSTRPAKAAPPPQPAPEADPPAEEITIDNVADITLDDLRARAVALARAGRKDDCIDALSRCGVERIGDLKESQYERFADLLQDIEVSLA